MTLDTRDGSDGQRGSALVISMLMVLAMAVLGVTFLSISLTDRTIARNEAAATRAFSAAEAGIERAIPDLPNQTINTLLTNGGALYTAAALGDAGTYTTIVSNNHNNPPYPTGLVPRDAGGQFNDTDGYLVLTATGASGSARRVVSQVVLGTGSAGMTYALGRVLFSKTSTIMGGGGQIWGDVGGNGNITANTTVHGNAAVTGTFTNPGNVTGTVTTGAAAVTLPDVTCPAIPYGPSPTGPGVTFSSVTGDVDIAGNSNSAIAAGTYLFHNFAKCCNGFTNFPLGGIVKIYISGSFNVSGNGFVNPNGTAGSIQIIACGTNTSIWDVNGNNNTWFTIYAPRHPITFAGNGHKNGAYVGATITKSGNGNVVYDATALWAAPPAVYTKVPRTWREIF